jgi:hypothetical protein
LKKLWAIALIFSISPALAQEAAPVAATPAAVDAVAAPPPAESPPPAPPAVPAVPVPENVPVALQPNSGNFPPLPPSRPCARPDADGLWQLKNVFEKPRGPTSADFANNPYQYILFLRDDTYRTYKEVWGEKYPEELKYELQNTPPTSVQQFVVHESGMVFFYVDGQNIDSQACFIVANALGPYQAGQMILMPPEGRIATRLALVYERVLENAAPKYDPEEADAGTPKKGRRKKK